MSVLILGGYRPPAGAPRPRRPSVHTSGVSCVFRFPEAKLGAEAPPCFVCLLIPRLATRNAFKVVFIPPAYLRDDKRFILGGFVVVALPSLAGKLLYPLYETHLDLNCKSSCFQVDLQGIEPDYSYSV